MRTVVTSGHKGVKLSAAENLIHQGQTISIINDAEFARLVGL